MLHMAPISGAGLQKAGVLVFSLCSGYMHPGSNFNSSLSPHLLEEIRHALCVLAVS